MIDKPQPTFEQILAAHERISQPIREELAQRTKAEKQYDDYLLAQLGKGKKFKTALRKANAKFSAQALNPGADQMSDTEEHYRFILDMQKIDECRRKIEAFDAEIGKIDLEIEVIRHQASEGPRDLPGQPGPS